MQWKSDLDINTLIKKFVLSYVAFLKKTEMKLKKRQIEINLTDIFEKLLARITANNYSGYSWNQQNLNLTLFFSFTMLFQKFSYEILR